MEGPCLPLGLRISHGNLSLSHPIFYTLTAVTFLDEAMQDPSDTPAHKPVPSLGALPSLPARVTLEDVRGALGSTPATGTNAGALRKVLGRGSLSTIQKHLDALRVQAAAPAQPRCPGRSATALPLFTKKALQGKQRPTYRQRYACHAARRALRRESMGPVG